MMTALPFQFSHSLDKTKSSSHQYHCNSVCTLKNIWVWNPILTLVPLFPQCPTPLCVCHRVKGRERDMRGDPGYFDSRSRKWEVLGKVQPTDMNNQSTTCCHAVVEHLKLTLNVKSRQNTTFISLTCVLKLWHLSIYCLWVNFHRRHIEVIAGKSTGVNNNTNDTCIPFVCILAHGMLGHLSRGELSLILSETSVLYPIYQLKLWHLG